MSPDLPRTTFGCRPFWEEVTFMEWQSITLPIELSQTNWEGDSNPQRGLVALTYWAIPIDIGRRIRTFDTQVGKQHRAKQHVIMKFITTLWRHSETRIRSLTFCFSRAFDRFSLIERFASRLCRNNIFYSKNFIVVSPRFELRIPFGQYGSKCASLLNFYEWSFGATANSIHYGE